MEKAPLPPLATIPSRAVADSRLSKTDWRVLASLCARRNKATKLCNPSVARIADDISVDPRHVRRSRDRLRTYGYIDWTREGSGRLSTCRYVILGLLPGDDTWGSRSEMRPNTALTEEEEDQMFGNLDEVSEGAGFDELGAEFAPLNGGEFSPPNIEKEHKNENIPKEHSASPRGDAGGFGEENAGG